MIPQAQFSLALFYCQRTPGSSPEDRQALEKTYGPKVRFFPIPCSGRLDALHLLRALEEFADAAYLIACPEGACRYFEGNRRAAKRLAQTRVMITAIGLEPERVGMVVRIAAPAQTLGALVGDIWQSASALGPSAVLHPCTP